MSRPLLLGIFALSLVVRLWFNFVFPHINNAGAADGSEYLRLAHAIDLYLSQPGSDLSILSGFKQAGPVFPLFILLCQKVGALLGSLPPSSAPVFGQCLLAAISDVLLCMTANLLYGRRCALICAAFAIFYPASIINSGRLYAESFSTSLCVILLYIMCRGFVGEKRNWLHFLGLGIGLASLQLARSVMIVLSFVSLPLTFFQERKTGVFKSLTLLLIGMALVMLPWLCVQKAVLNKASLVVDRVGNYNLFVGTNPDISGWLSYPYPDGTGIESRSALAVLTKNVRLSLGRSIKLMLDKPYRLAKFPWNDFRTDIGFFTFPLQVAFHQFLLLLCAVGICLAFITNSDRKPVEQGILRARLLLFAYFASHAIYWFFITVPRYNMTAIPVLILFAAAGAAALMELFNENRKRAVLVFNALLLFFLCARINEIGLLFQVTGSPALSLILLCALKALAAGLFFYLLWKLSQKPSAKSVIVRAVFISVAFAAIIVVAYPARANGRAFEWQAQLLNKGDRITQQFVFSKNDLAALSDKRLFLLFDTDGVRDFVENGRIMLNGEPLNAPVIPGISLTQDFSAAKYMGKEEDQLYFECEWIYERMTVSAGIGAADIRQWFVVPLPLDMVSKIAASGTLSVEIENVSGVRSFKVFGNYDPVKLLPSVDSSSWEKAFYGVENDRGFTDSRYDVKQNIVRHTNSRLVSANKKSEADLSPSPGIQTGSYNLLLSAVPRMNSPQTFSLNAPLPRKLSLKNGEAKTFRTALLSRPAAGPNDVWLFRLKGKSSASNALHANIIVEPKLTVHLSNASVKTITYPCRWLSRNLPNYAEPTAFDYCFPMMPGLLKEKIASIEVSLERKDFGSAANMSLEIDDLELEVESIYGNPVSSYFKESRLY
ncbi:MAG: hypothetical protein DKT66_03975 [Candidatus Melainabacteria bacterium]|nr:MAG: hypothetical protein DKT66_03975 [Candidatus Melainabacteria bacterium]